MLQKGNQILETPVTHATLKWQQMCLLVSLKVDKLSECFWTRVTPVWLLACVDKVMSRQFRRGFKLFEASVADVRPLPWNFMSS